MKHRSAVTALLALLLNGCASYATISTAQPGTAKVYSGTRLDLRALNGQRLPTRAFRCDPPSHPGLDLPLSFALDTLLFPLTFPAALFETLAE
jgi:uncharacterized protein YceK